MISKTRPHLRTTATIITALAMVALSSAPGCASVAANPKGDQQVLNNNKQVAIGLSKAIMNGDWDQVENLLADDFSYVGDGAPAIGKAQYIGFMKNVLSSAMTEMEMDFVRVVAEGDLVAIEYTNTMTHSGELFGVPATQKRVVATGHFIRQVRDGKVVAEWQTTNAMGLMKQLTK